MLITQNNILLTLNNKLSNQDNPL